MTGCNTGLSCADTHIPNTLLPVEPFDWCCVVLNAAHATTTTPPTHLQPQKLLNRHVTPNVCCICSPSLCTTTRVGHCPDSSSSSEHGLVGAVPHGVYAYSSCSSNQRITLLCVLPLRLLLVLLLLVVFACRCSGYSSAMSEGDAAAAIKPRCTSSRAAAAAVAGGTTQYMCVCLRSRCSGETAAAAAACTACCSSARMYVTNAPLL